MSKTFAPAINMRHKKWYRTTTPGIHSKEECQRMMQLDDPIEKWRCCPRWQRKLGNKWNARLWAQKHGIPVPDLYWVGRGDQLSQIPFDKLPTQYVIKPTNSWSCKGVYLMSNGVNLFNKKKYTIPELKVALRKTAKEHPHSRFLVEEMVQSENGQFKIPVDYKCHMFGGYFESILAIYRLGAHSGSASFFTENWQIKKDGQTLHQAPYKMKGTVSPPKCFKDMVQYAKILGAACQTFMRIDFYATTKGAVFGEFTAFPNAAHHYNRYADHWLPRWKQLDQQTWDAWKQKQTQKKRLKNEKNEKNENRK